MKTTTKLLAYPVAGVGVLMAAVAVTDRISQHRRYVRAAPAREAAKLASEGTVPDDWGTTDQQRELSAALGAPAPFDPGPAVEQMASVHQLYELKTALMAALLHNAPVVPAPSRPGRRPPEDAADDYSSAPIEVKPETVKLETITEPLRASFVPRRRVEGYGRLDDLDGLTTRREETSDDECG